MAVRYAPVWPNHLNCELLIRLRHTGGGRMWRAVLKWLRKLLAGAGLGESGIDREIQEAQDAFKSAINPTDHEEPND